MLKTLAIYIFELIMLFLAFSFTKATFNIEKWDEIDRIMYVFNAMACLILTLAVMNKSNLITNTKTDKT